MEDESSDVRGETDYVALIFESEEACSIAVRLFRETHREKYMAVPSRETLIAFRTDMEWFAPLLKQNNLRHTVEGARAASALPSNELADLRKRSIKSSSQLADAGKRKLLLKEFREKLAELRHLGQSRSN